jgi:hypothetical protein
MQSVRIDTVLGARSCDDLGTLAIDVDQHPVVTTD